jgi:hypothetical protein
LACDNGALFIYLSEKLNAIDFTGILEADLP